MSWYTLYSSPAATKTVFSQLGAIRGSWRLTSLQSMVLWSIVSFLLHVCSLQYHARRRLPFWCSCTHCWVLVLKLNVLVTAGLLYTVLQDIVINLVAIVVFGMKDPMMSLCMLSTVVIKVMLSRSMSMSCGWIIIKNKASYELYSLLWNHVLLVYSLLLLLSKN